MNKWGTCLVINKTQQREEIVISFHKNRNHIWDDKKVYFVGVVHTLLDYGMVSVTYNNVLLLCCFECTKISNQKYEWIIWLVWFGL